VRSQRNEESGRTRREPLVVNNRKRSSRRRGRGRRLYFKRNRRRSPRLTTVIYEDEEFFYQSPSLSWDRLTQRSFFIWARKTTGWNREQLTVISQFTGSQPEEPEGRTRVLLAPDERWTRTEVVIGRKKMKKTVLKGIRAPQLCIKTGSRL
jgi:hypothetical protein